jgi:integrase
VRYFPSRKAYYCQIDGAQNYLGPGPDDAPHGPNYQAACQKFSALICDFNSLKTPDRNPVGLILAKYLLHCRAHRRPKTVKLRERFYRPFGERCGDICVTDLRHAHVYEFMAEMRAVTSTHPWNDQTCRMFVGVLQAALNWACKPGVGLATYNPLKGIERPGPRSRGRGCLVSAEQHRKILAAASPQLREILTALENTGARPGELTAAQADAWDDELGALVYYQDALRGEGEFAHKTSADKERIIFFTGEALALVRRLVGQRQAGPLFRNAEGRAWTMRGLQERLQAACKRADVQGVVPYSYRHTFATNWLKAGGNIDQLAGLMGNTVEVIRQNYAHLLSDKKGLRAALEAFRSSQGQPASRPKKLRVFG